MTGCIPELTFRIGEGMHLNCVSKCCDGSSDDEDAKESKVGGAVPRSQFARQSGGSDNVPKEPQNLKHHEVECPGGCGCLHYPQATTDQIQEESHNGDHLAGTIPSGST